MAILTRNANKRLAVLAIGLPTLSLPVAAYGSAYYGYDALGRVDTALYDNGACVAYTYDAGGNRTSRTNTVSGAPESPIWGAGFWGCFTWTPQSR